MPLYPIPPISWPNSPATNITPFTYRDGLSYLQRLERIVRYVNKNVIPYVNESYTELAETTQENVNNLIEQVNSLVQAVIDDSIELQDPVMAGIVSDETSNTYSSLYEILSTMLNEDPTDIGFFIINLPEPV